MVGEKTHGAIEERLRSGRLENRFALVVSRQPGKPFIVAQDTSFSPPGKRATGRKFPLPYRVALIEANSFINEIVVQESDHGKALLHCAVCKAHPRMEIPDLVSFGVGLVRHIINVGHNICFRCLDERARGSLAESQVVISSTTIGMNGALSKAKHHLRL